MCGASGRALGLALVLEFWGASAVSAHALPGSVLTISRGEDEMTLSIHLPLEDLALASSLVLSLTADAPATAEALSLTLTYDAVMHEVRNHRATVFWASPDRRPVMVADFGFRPTNGAQQPILLVQPQE